MKGSLFLSAGVGALMLAARPAAAQTDSAVSEVIVTGTRAVGGMRASDSPAPIEVVGAAALKQTGYADLPDALAANVPSLNVQMVGNDSASLVMQAALRGISPNDTLVLVNGKRRNITADLGNDGGSPYSGSATVDLSFIPVGAIDHVEVLTDGAAAQYGSDAIAGVINVILKNSPSAGVITATAGQNYQGDGATGQWSVNKGFALGDKGYFNITLEEQAHGATEVGKYDARYQAANGTLLPGLPAIYYTGIPNAPNYPNENRSVGNASYNLYNAFFNAGYDLGDGLEAYAFGSYGTRVAAHGANYRPPDKVVGLPLGSTTPVFPLPNGFELQEAFKEYNYSFTGGLKGSLAGWHWDLSTVYGGDNDKVYSIDDANPGLFAVQQAASASPVVPQRRFYDGSYSDTEWATTLDLDRSFGVGLASPLNVGLGLEYRKDTYRILPGEPASYEDGGAQGFDGFDPLDFTKVSRSNYAAYVDLAVDPIAHFHVDLAGRFEHYSDFGDATVGKLTARYDFNPNFAVRGTVSTGFRAPTLQEEFFSGIDVSPSAAEVQVPPNSSASSAAGFSKLRPETSRNLSVGFVAHPIDHLQITADYYYTGLKDRILTSGFLLGYINGFPNNGVISQAVLDAIAARHVTLDSGVSYAGIAIFANAANTRTQGVEATANYASDFGDFGDVDWSVGFNYNQTTATKLAPLPASVVNPDVGQTEFLDAASLSALTTALPKEKVILQALWTKGAWSANLRSTVYGPASSLASPDGTGAGTGAFVERIPVTAIFDLDLGYKITRQLKIDVGANNLFSTRPPRVPTVNGVPADGNAVYDLPYTFAAWSIYGGYYYGRLTYTF